MKGIDTHRLGNTRSRSIAAKLHVKPLALLVSLLATGQAFAVQTGTVTGGAATITQSGATTTIQQTSDRAIVNWKNFDIGQGERVNIRQPNANSAILNRVVGATTATQIKGALDANGRVFVINPNGIVVGPQGTINANGVVLSTLNLMSDDDFISGSTSLNLMNAGATNLVRNDGTITAPAGAVLLGNQVVNGPTGQIITQRGDVSLGSSLAAAIDLSADGSITLLPLNGGAAGLAANDGRISAGGSVLMQVIGADAIVRNTGTIEANGLAGLTDSGTVTLQANTGTVDVGGTVTGQHVDIMTTNVTQAAGASLHADGDVTITTIAPGQVVLNGDISAGDTFSLGSIFARNANVTLNGTVAAQDVALYAAQLNVAQNAAVNAASVSLTSQGDAMIAGSIDAASDLSIKANGSVAQTADGLLRFGASSTISAPSVVLNGTIDAGASFTVATPGGSVFGAGMYQPGQGFGGTNASPPPVNAAVSSGTGSITQDGNAINVVQSSDKLVLDWGTFNIAAGDSINFVQPNANAAVLNRVVSPQATTIDGALNANGRVFLINPYGIVISPTGTINANSVTLVAGDLLSSSDADVLSGDTWDVLTTPIYPGPSSGQVLNSGDIHAANGVTMIGSQVINLTSGRLYTWGGNIAMVAGGEVRVSQNADGSMSGVDALNAIPNALVANDGRITADNSYVKLDAYTSTASQVEVARSLGQIDALNRTDTMSAPGELAAGNILISGRNANGFWGTVNIRGRLIGQNVTVHSDGNLYLFGGGVLTLRQQSADPDFNKITLEGHRITVAPEGFTVEGSAVLRGIGFGSVFDKQGPFNVIGDDLSLIDIAPLQN
jgi:filamentous hemagglutinin family protein